MHHRAHGVGLDALAHLRGDGLGADAMFAPLGLGAAADEAGVRFAHREPEPPVRLTGADQVRPGPRQRLGLRDAIGHLEKAPVKIHARLGPQSLDHRGPFLGQHISVVVVQRLVPGAHLSKFIAVGAGHDVEPGSAARDVIQGGDHLGDHSRIMQQGVRGRPDLDAAGRLGDAGHHGDGFHRGGPMVGRSAEPAPLSHRQDEVQAVAFRRQRRVKVGPPAAVERRRRLGNDPAAVGDRQKDPEIPF